MASDPSSSAASDGPFRIVDANDPDEGVKAFLTALFSDPGGHEWAEVSAFAGRFCGRCGVDEDDHDDPRRERCNA